jgi:hypothetical protein
MVSTGGGCGMRDARCPSSARIDAPGRHRRSRQADPDADAGSGIRTPTGSVSYGGRSAAVRRSAAPRSGDFQSPTRTLAEGAGGARLGGSSVRAPTPFLFVSGGCAADRPRRCALEPSPQGGRSAACPRLATHAPSGRGENAHQPRFVNFVVNYLDFPPSALNVEHRTSNIERRSVPLCVGGGCARRWRGVWRRRWKGRPRGLLPRGPPAELPWAPVCSHRAKFFVSMVQSGSRCSSLSSSRNMAAADSLFLSCQSSQARATRVNSPPWGWA